MKKIIISFIGLACGLSATAQRASDSALAGGDYKDYNRIGISYDNAGYSYNKEYGSDHKENNFSTNGFGINYIHGFSLSSNLPLFIETGANINFGFNKKQLDRESFGKYYVEENQHFFNVNAQVPVNVAWKFGVGDDFSITPYLGLNFKLHIVSQAKYSIDTNLSDSELSSEGISKDDLEGDWYSVFDDKDDAMGGKDYTWNRFQMGWHLGVGFQYKPFYLGVQWGTDFIPAYSHKFDDGEHPKINTNNLKLTLGFCF